MCLEVQLVRLPQRVVVVAAAAEQLVVVRRNLIDDGAPLLALDAVVG